MVAAIRILGYIIIAAVGVGLMALFLAISAVFGLMVHFVLIGAPVLLTVVLALKDLYVQCKLKQWLKQNPPSR
jgi:hypothetical protein